MSDGNSKTDMEKFTEKSDAEDFQKIVKLVQRSVEPYTIHLGSVAPYESFVAYHKGYRFKLYKGDRTFGRSVAVVIPPHGDMNCTCTPCIIYRYVIEYKKRNWTVESITSSI